MNKRVFVTGMSAVTACGDDLEQTWQSIYDGRTGIDAISQWPSQECDYAMAGEVKNYNPRRMLPDKKLLKVISRQDVLGIHAATTAVDDSGMIEYRDAQSQTHEFNERCGVYVGSPGNKYQQQYDFLPLMANSENMSDFAGSLFDTVHPMWLLRILPNNVLAYTGITYGFKGPNHNITNHAVSSLQALQEAYYAIQQGVIDRAVVVAYDCGAEPQAIINYGQLGLLSRSAIKPFDDERDGTILAEGAVALVIESEDSVNARDATCHAEILQGFSITEGSGLFSIEDEAEHLSKLIDKTLTANRLTASDIGMITTHGNGNGKSDSTEAKSLVTTFGDCPTTAFKWATGHTITASGLLDCALTIKALKARVVPGIATLKQVASDCQGLSVQTQARTLNNPMALILNRGFASMNSTMVIKACD